jgi:hypothetical protein
MKREACSLPRIEHGTKFSDKRYFAGKGISGSLEGQPTSRALKYTDLISVWFDVDYTTCLWFVWWGNVKGRD